MRDFIENVRRNHDQIIDSVNLDKVLFAGYSANREENADRVNYNFKQWTFHRNTGAVHFTAEQMEWLRLIKEHIITSLSILPEDLEYTPFDSKGGLGGFYRVFGEKYQEILDEMNEELVA